MKSPKIVLLAAFALLPLAAPAFAEAPPVDARAKRAYKAKCASCHGEDGKGQTQQAKEKFDGKLQDLSDPEVQKKIDDGKLKEAITKGIIKKKDGKEFKMPATEIQGEQLDNLVRYVRGLAQAK